MHTVLIKPLITEKSMQEAATGRFAFSVLKSANKPEIAMAVQQAFPVKVIGVKTVTKSGKTRRAGRARREVTGSSWKKAVVQLESGQKIDLFDTTGDQKPGT